MNYQAAFAVSLLLNILLSWLNTRLREEEQRQRRWAEYFRRQRDSEADQRKLVMEIMTKSIDHRYGINIQCQKQNHQSPEPGDNGPKHTSSGGFVLDSGECRSAGQGGLWQSSEHAGPTPDQTHDNDGNTSAPDAAIGSLTRKSKPIT